MTNKILAFDQGIGSLGFAIIEQENAQLIEFGTKIFNSASKAEEPRLKRSARRTLRRKKWRKQQLLDAFVDFNLLTRDEINQNDYLSYTANNDILKRPEYDTVYHLRKAALIPHNKISKREILLCLYNILQARGHFLMEGIDFENNDSISFDIFKERFYEVTELYINYENREGFENNILECIFNGLLNKNEIKNILQDIRICEKDDESILLEIIYLLKGYKADLTFAFETDEEADKKYSFNISELRKLDDTNDFILNLIELYDLIKIHKVLDEDCKYICDLAVKEIDKLTNAFVNDQEEYKKLSKEIKGKMANDKKSPKAWKNLENNFPNGLYLKEVNDILKNQQEFYEEITDEFIRVCKLIVSARIPYYIGPLSVNAKNSWVDKKQGFKYSYEYSKDNSIDEFNSIKTWKERMVSRCTYLPDEIALPKGSFVGEVYSIINELNVLTAEDKNGDTYYLTNEDKVKIFDELYLKKNKKITFEEIKSLLNLNKFGTKNKTGQKQTNTQLTAYHKVVSVFEELKFDSINEIFANEDKLSKLENIILDINLFDEEESKKEYFSNEKYGFKLDDKKAKTLSKIKLTGFYSISKKFLMNTPVTRNKETILELLFSNNVKNKANELMTIVSEAVDESGNKLDLNANKYIKILKEHDNDLSIDLLIEDGKPIVPMSRVVIRSLNECMKVYKEIVRLYGVPDRIILEASRELTEPEKKGKKTPTKEEKLKSLYDDLKKQAKEHKTSFELDEWEDLRSKLDDNKDKIELYIRQNGKDIITNEDIVLDNLHDYEVDHILPRGFGDDSLDNKILIKKIVNDKKSNRVPLQFIENPNGIELKTTVSSFIHRVEELHSLKLISDKKRDMLLLETDEEVEGFIERNLVDTRYIIREFMSILNAYNKVNGYNETKIVALKSSYTDLYRKVFNIKKNRDLGVQHHAIDAAMIAVADATLSTYFPNYDSRGNYKKYQEFIVKMNEYRKNHGDEKKDLKKELRKLIKYAYNKAFNEPCDYPTSLINAIKNTVPLYSIKVEKNYKGAFFNETLKSPNPKKNNNATKDLKTSVLSKNVLNINNDKRIYFSVECVAVDFYKYTDNKGNKKHAAIHIPKVIIDENGKIIKDKYLILIKNHYKINELIDKDGNLKEKCFKFRAFENDVIYDDVTYIPQIFNKGSIVKKILEMHNIDIFSYNKIYGIAYEIVKELKEEFHLEYNELWIDENVKNEVLKYILSNYFYSESDTRKHHLYDILIKEKTIFDLCNNAAYYISVLNRISVSYNLNEKRDRPSVNKTIFKENPDARYVKLKYNILGVRFKYDQNKKLIIEGPNTNKNAYKKVTKEKFSWYLSKFDV